MWYILSFLFGTLILPAAVKGLQTKNTVFPEYNIFYPIIHDIIEFEVKSGHDAWIGFFAEPNSFGPKIEVALGSHDNTVVEILRNRTVSLQKFKLQVLDYYNYRGFVIRFKNRIKTPDLMISVFRAGESIPFASIIDHEHMDIKYFAVATTGADMSGNWILKDIDLNSGINVDPNLTIVGTKATIGTPIYTKFYRLSDNLIRFKVKASDVAWIRLTPNRSSFPNYEVSFGSNNNHEVIIYNMGTQVKAFYDYSILNKQTYTGYWIEISENIDYYGSKAIVISIGHEKELTGFLKYEDTTATQGVKYFSIATTSNTKGLLALWKLVDILP